MRYRSFVMLLTAILACAATGVSQTAARGTQGKQSTGNPDPDSVRAYARALARKDTTAIKRYNAFAGRAKTFGPREAQIVLMTRAERDSIVLRWAPSKPGAWIETNKYGYMLDRVTMGKNGKVVPGSMQQLTTLPLKPWTLDEWKERVRRDNKFAAIAAQALYGKSFKQRTDVPEGVAMRAGVEELEGRFGFSLFAADMDPLVANGLALRYVDRNIKQGEQYVYRVHLAVKDTAYHLDTAYAVASPEHQETPPPPLELTADGFDRHITLRWKDYPPGLAYSAYNVYRSEDGGKSYTRLNANPVVTPYREGFHEKLMPTYTDTTIVNYRRYRYQVRGITPFAEESKPAEVEAYGTDKTPPPRPVIGKPEQIGRHTVRLTWEMPDTVKDIAGFVISRSADNMEGYVPITVSLPPVKAPKGKGKQTPREQELETRQIMKQLLPPQARSYVDTGATSAEPYYMVGAVDTSGNLSQSLPAYAAIIDSLPPKMPTGLAGKIDTNGVVHLHWNLGPEPNIIGYRVVWANDPKHEFTQRTPRPVKDTVFTDTINIHTLTHYIYYRIAAVNDRFIHSPLSPMLALRRPDVVPPGTPVFTNVVVSDSSIHLTWATSSSDDVKKQVLYRRKSGEEAWTPLASLAASQDSYLDHAVSQRTMYEYSLEAVDSSGLRSKPAVPVQGRAYDTGARPGVTAVNGIVDAKGKFIRLSWSYSASLKEKYWFVIYRAFDAGSLMEYRSVESSARIFNDTNLLGKGTYKYAVRVQTAVGGLSPISQPITVEIK
jgi:fibronectin type 3 domain-containing protein